MNTIKRKNQTKNEKQIEREREREREVTFLCETTTHRMEKKMSNL